MNRLAFCLVLLLSACAATASDQPNSAPSDYEVYLAGIEKWRNHHNDSIQYTAAVSAAAGNPDLRYSLTSTKYRNAQGIPERITLVVDGRFDQQTFMDSAIATRGPIDTWKTFTGARTGAGCQADNWCPTEGVRITFTNLELDTFSETGLPITFRGTAGSTELTIQADYFRAFRDSFSLPPEWTKSGGIF